MTTALVIFGKLNDRSGGFYYDSKLVEALHRAGHTVKVVSQPWRTTLREQRAIAKTSTWIEETAATNPDLVLIDELNHAATASGLTRLRGALASTTRLVAIVHHLRSDERFIGPRARATERRFLRSCDAWLCNGPTTLRRVRARASVPRAAGVAMPGRDSLPAAPTARISRGSLRVLCVGSVEPRKNVETLLKAIAVVPAVTLSVAGSLETDPEYVKELRALCRRLDVLDRVRFLGRVDRDVLQQLYREHDVFALPSRYEGFGIVYLEAMSYGLPVIATRRGGARDLLRHGIEGYLVSPRTPRAAAEALRDLVAGGGLRRRLGDAAYRRAATLPSWEQSMSGAVRFLEQVVRRSGERQ